MQILFAVTLLFLLLVSIIIATVTILNFKYLSRISKHLGIEPEKNEKKKQQEEAQKNKEKSDEAYTNLLVEISEEKQAKDNAPFGTYMFDELDVFDELEHTETDPEKLLKILEFGLPDEELESIIKKLEVGK